MQISTLEKYVKLLKDKQIHLYTANPKVYDVIQALHRLSDPQRDHFIQVLSYLNNCNILSEDNLEELILNNALPGVFAELNSCINLNSQDLDQVDVLRCASALELNVDRLLFVSIPSRHDAIFKKLAQHNDYDMFCKNFYLRLLKLYYDIPRDVFPGASSIASSNQIANPKLVYNILQRLKQVLKDHESLSLDCVNAILFQKKDALIALNEAFNRLEQANIVDATIWQMLAQQQDPCNKAAYIVNYFNNYAEIQKHINKSNAILQMPISTSDKSKNRLICKLQSYVKDKNNALQRIKDSYDAAQPNVIKQLLDNTQYSLSQPTDEDKNRLEIENAIDSEFLLEFDQIKKLLLELMEIEDLYNNFQQESLRESAAKKRAEIIACCIGLVTWSCCAVPLLIAIPNIGGPIIMVLGIAMFVIALVIYIGRKLGVINDSAMTRDLMRKLDDIIPDLQPQQTHDSRVDDMPRLV